MKSIKISPQQARDMVLNAQLLNGQANLPKGKEGVAGVFEKLGYIQIDTISVIERAHHHTLWTRSPDYDPEMLHELQAKDRRVFEYWGHAMSYLPMNDYRYCLPRMRNFQNPQHKWVKLRLEQSGHLMKPVLERIRQEGPLGSKDFEPPPGEKRGNWWDWKPAKFALELLMWRGELMISERRKFQKIYDLTERVLPNSIDTSYPGDDELGRFFVQRGLSALGLAREKELYGFLQPDAARDSDFLSAGKNVLLKSLNDLLESGEVLHAGIESDENSDYFVLAETIAEQAQPKQTSPAAHLLSPFDNLIIQRERTKRLFDFDYTLECYVPEPKRKYGYFVLPILWGNTLVGRLDPKAERREKTLYIRSLLFEADFNRFDEFLAAFAEKLQAFARFNQCEKIVLGKVVPAGIKKNIQRMLK